MAGIGFELHRLMRSDRLSSQLQGFLQATVIAAGPWLLTSLALTLMHALARGQVEARALLTFNSIALWAFSISLVVAGPYVLVVARCVADAAHARRVDDVASMMLAALARVFAILAVIGVVLFGWLPLAWSERVLGFLLLVVCGGVWVVAGLMSALRSHATVVVAFALGALTLVSVTAFGGASAGTVGLLTALLAGLAIVLFVIAARMLAEFPTHGGAAANVDPEAADAAAELAPPPFKLRKAMRRYRHLAWAGLLYSVALWVDKWIMAFAPGSQQAGLGLHSHPSYEGAMFLALLTIVPLLALLLVDVETTFQMLFRRYFRSLDEGATLRILRRHHGAIMRHTASSFRRLAILQLGVAVPAILAAAGIVASLGGGLEMVPIFRFGVLGAAFHGLLIVCLAALAYFDQRNAMVRACAAFFVVNAVVTSLSAWLGPAYYGWGYAVGAIVGFAFALHGAMIAIAKLPYMTFIGVNEAVRAVPERAPEAERRLEPHGSVLAGGALNRRW